MIQEILVPLDTSPLAEQALPHVRQVAKAFGSQIHLLSVVEGPGAVNGDSVDWRLSRGEHQAYLEQKAEEFREAGFQVDSQVVSGVPAEQILQVARDRSADLVVVTSHGRGGLTEFRLSGTASKILSGVETSILVIRPETSPRAEGPARILVPVDCSQRSDWAASLAAQIARAQGAELLLVAVIEPPQMLRSLVVWTEQASLARRLAELNRGVAESHLEYLAKQISNDHLQVATRVVEETDAARTLQRIADEEDCSLVVLSAHGQGTSASCPYGAVTREMVEHCDRPLLVFQDTETTQGQGTDEVGFAERLRIAK